MTAPAVSAVVSTFQRPDACERAVASALAQTYSPIEVLVCDDGSRDETHERMRELERRDDRVRYLRLEPNRGTPGPARNLGIANARGDWIGFLDDDDQWLPGKLECQLALAGRADVIAGNAERSDGHRFFASAQGTSHPTRAEILQANPLINSTVLARRDLLLEAGGFMTERWVRGIEDYALWLELADAGARFAVLAEPLVLYDSDGEDRFSASPLRPEIALARLAWVRMARRLGDPLLRRAALNRTHGAATVALDQVAAASRRPRS